MYGVKLVYSICQSIVDYLLIDYQLQQTCYLSTANKGHNRDWQQLFL